ncbi:hypothetical protein LCGC14_1984390 [marine sediment metagenome]|uniref:Uncharacterized protein n=1 Tax=marine sediment metagenome TaxID=412755 RepID=A0A0F9F7V7_9ZZZZ
MTELDSIPHCRCSEHESELESTRTEAFSAMDALAANAVGRPWPAVFCRPARPSPVRRVLVPRHAAAARGRAPRHPAAGSAVRSPRSSARCGGGRSSLCRCCSARASRRSLGRPSPSALWPHGSFLAERPGPRPPPPFCAASVSTGVQVCTRSTLFTGRLLIAGGASLSPFRKEKSGTRTGPKAPKERSDPLRASFFAQPGRRPEEVPLMRSRRRCKKEREDRSAG